MKQRIKASDIVEMIRERHMTRPEIKDELGLTHHEMKALFSREPFSSMRARKPKEIGFVLDMDLEGYGEENAAEDGSLDLTTDQSIEENAAPVPNENLGEQAYEEVLTEPGNNSNWNDPSEDFPTHLRGKV